eukprot:1023637-Amphidinium_carterae.1
MVGRLQTTARRRVTFRTSVPYREACCLKILGNDVEPCPHPRYPIKRYLPQGMVHPAVAYATLKALHKCKDALNRTSCQPR